MNAIKGLMKVIGTFMARVWTYVYERINTISQRVASTEVCDLWSTIRVYPSSRWLRHNSSEWQIIVVLVITSSFEWRMPVTSICYYWEVISLLLAWEWTFPRWIRYMTFQFVANFTSSISPLINQEWPGSCRLAFAVTADRINDDKQFIEWNHKCLFYNICVYTKMKSKQQVSW